jgi:hypothetical protein
MTTDPTPILDSDEDFSDLDSIIADAEADLAAKRSLDAKRKRLLRGMSEDDRIKLLAQIRAAEDVYVWRTVAGVALFHSQHCLSCGHEHRFFMGWMTLQQHKTDPNCRRYVRGRPTTATPLHTENHAQPDVELCADCAESCILLESIVDSVDAEIVRKQEAARLQIQRARIERQEEEAARIRASLDAAKTAATGEIDINSIGD